MSETPAAAPESGFALTDLSVDAKALSAQAFADRYGEAFFLHDPRAGALDRPQRAAATRISNEESLRRERAERNAALRVYALRSTGRSPFPNFISVGRTRNNDLVIEDSSLSKFHAYVRRAEDGRYLIQDAGSKNGTKVDGVEVPVRDRGEPLPMAPSSRILLGGVTVVFLTAEQIQDWARRA